MSVVFSSWSVPRLYNERVFAAEIILVEYRLAQDQTRETAEYRVENHGNWSQN
jgi:hypothetical protein